MQRLEAGNYEIVDNDDDYYTVNYNGDIRDIMPLPKKPVTFSGSVLIKHMDILEGLIVCRSLTFDYIEEFITIENLNFYDEELVSDFLSHYPKAIEADISNYLMDHIEPNILADQLNQFEMLEIGTLKIEEGELIFIHQLGCKYSEKEIRRNNHYLIDIEALNKSQRNAIKHNDSALENIVDEVTGVLKKNLGI